jgi:predicted PurR-regulated permease PerM
LSGCPRPAGWKLPGIEAKAARVTLTAALTLALLAAVYTVRGTLFLFAVALLFAYLLYPLVGLVGHRFAPKNQTPALAITYLGVLGILVLIGIGVGSPVAAEARELVAQPPDVRGFLLRLQIAHPALAPLIETVQGQVRQQLGDMVSAAPRMGLRVLAASANLIALVVIPVVSFFILKDGRVMLDGFLSMFRPGASRDGAERALREVHELLLQYMRALALLCCVVLVVFSTVLSLMDVPYALLLSSIAFLCEFVPLVGPITAAGLILAVSAINGYPHLWWIAIFLGAFRLLQDYVVSPKLMSRGVELHPVLVIFGVFAGAEIGGVEGVFLSVPVLAMARLVLRRFGQPE